MTKDWNVENYPRNVTTKMECLKKNSPGFLFHFEIMNLLDMKKLYLIANSIMKNHFIKIISQFILFNLLVYFI